MHIITDERGRIMGQGRSGLAAGGDCYFGAGNEKVPCPIGWHSIAELPDGWVYEERPYAHRVRNFTPHDLSIYPEDESSDSPPVTFASAGVARAAETDTEGGDQVHLGDLRVPMIRRSYSDVEGLPPVFEPGAKGRGEGSYAIMEDDVIVVSVVTAKAMQDCGLIDAINTAGAYVVTPDTGGGVVRDDQGRIIGTRRLVRVMPGPSRHTGPHPSRAKDQPF